MFQVKKANSARLEALIFVAKERKVWEESFGECDFTVVVPGAGSGTRTTRMSEEENNTLQLQNLVTHRLCWGCDKK